MPAAPQSLEKMSITGGPHGPSDYLVFEAGRMPVFANKGPRGFKGVDGEERKKLTPRSWKELSDLARA